MPTNDEPHVRIARLISVYNLFVPTLRPGSAEYLRLLQLGLELTQLARSMDFAVQLDMKLGEIVNDETMLEGNDEQQTAAGD